MRKVALLFLASFCGCSLLLAGCSGGGSNTVIEAPPQAEEEHPAIEGMTDEEYNEAMDEDMSG